MALPVATVTDIMPHLMTWKAPHIFAMALAGWMNREQQDVIAYLREENRILREKLGHKRIILNEPQKRRLATAGMKLGKDLLRQFGTLFSRVRCSNGIGCWSRGSTTAPTAAASAGRFRPRPT
jgi:hypothetical protein